MTFSDLDPFSNYEDTLFMKGKVSTDWQVIETLEFRKHFGENLKRIRKIKGIPQDQFAEECHISRAYYGRIERGEYSATIDICFQIARALAVEVHELFRDLPE